MMTPDELARWQTKQIAAAVTRGVNPVDAAAAVKRFMARLPAGADPNTFVAPAMTLNQDLTSSEISADLRASWYGDSGVSRRFKRLLDATQAS
jgi:hypothetical protein